MAFESIGLGANLTFDERQAVAAMGRARDQFGRFIKTAERGGIQIPGAFNRIAASAQRASASVKRVGAGFSKVGRAFAAATIAAAPMAAGVAFAAKQAVNFEQGMADVRAVMKGVSEKDFGRLTATAKKMGATTSFTATQAAEGLQNLARAGFSADQSIDALGGVLNAAAADSIDLGTAAGIVANTVRGFGLEAKQATGVADVLALTSARTNTDIVSLGEGMKFVAPIAKGLGVDVKDTSLALGLLANAGLKGTVGGTALKNMLLKLAKPTEKTKKEFNRLGIRIQDASGNMLPFRSVIANLAQAMPKMGGNLKRTGLLAEAFGLRGQGAAQNLSSAFIEMSKDVDEQGRSAFEKLATEIQNAEGSAKQMAETKLDTVLGQMTLLRSAVEGFAIELFGPLLGAFKGVFKFARTGLGDVVTGIQMLRGGGGETTEEFQNLGSTVQAIAKGVNGAINTIVSVTTRLGAMFSSAKRSLIDFLGPAGLAKLAKLGTLFGVAVGAMAPVAAGLVGLALAIKLIVIPAVSGLAGIISGVLGVAFGPVGLAILAVIGLIVSMKRETETWGAFALRMWTSVKTAVMDFWTTTLQPLVQGIKEGLLPALEPVKQAWLSVFEAIRFSFGEVMSIFGSGTKQQQVDWLEVGRTVGAVIGALVEAIGRTIEVAVILGGAVTQVAAMIGKALFENVVGVFETVGKAVGGVAAGFAQIFSGDVIAGIKTLGQAWLDFVLTPIKAIVRNIVRMADLVPGIGKLVPAGLRQFAREEAVRVLPRRTPGAAPREAAAIAARRRDRSAESLADRLGKVQTDSADKVADKIAKAMKDKRTEVNVPVNIDGRAVAFATTKHAQEIQERSGFRATPWQRRVALEHGAVPMTTGG